MASEAAVQRQRECHSWQQVDDVPKALGSLTASGLLGGFCAVSGNIVEVEEERLKVFASGARWVSLSSGRRSVMRVVRGRLSAG